MELRRKVAAALAYNDECGPGPLSSEEYLADADELIKIVIQDAIEAFQRQRTRPMAKFYPGAVIFLERHYGLSGNRH